MKKMKSWILAVSLLITNMAMGQTIADGLHLIDRDQPSRAKQVFEGLVTASPTGENYYYLGYYYLSRRDWAGAEDAFKKGLAADPKNYLNQVGLAAIKVGQNKVNEAKVDFDRILQETKYKNGDVIHRIAEAYEMFYKLGRDPEFNAVFFEINLLILGRIVVAHQFLVLPLHSLTLFSHHHAVSDFIVFSYAGQTDNKHKFRVK